MRTDTPRVGLVIPTLNAGENWPRCIAAIEVQSIPLRRRLIIDSSSEDATAALSRKANFEVRIISRTDFNHGGTRQLAVEALNDCDIVVMLTQDALLASPDSVAELARCFDDPSVAVAYGRQLPHLGATAIEAHARLFNYGDSSVRKDAASVARYGPKAFFCSNSFAAYRRDLLLQLGGFRRDLILAEDAEYAARAIVAGYANAYCATAVVRHSHDYTLLQQLRRYFDVGVFESQTRWMGERFGSHNGEGARFVSSELAYLLRHAPWELPRAMAQSAAKIVGYRLGKSERSLSNSVKRSLSMSPRFWL